MINKIKDNNQKMRFKSNEQNFDALADKLKQNIMRRKKSKKIKELGKGQEQGGGLQ